LSLDTITEQLYLVLFEITSEMVFSRDEIGSRRKRLEANASRPDLCGEDDAPK
jgi:hypothetical protein